MAITITKVSFTADSAFARDPRELAELVVDVAFDDSYPTGGETFNVSTWLSSVYSVTHVPSDAAAEGLAGARVYAHDKGTAAAGLLLVYLEDAVSGIYGEETAAADLSSLTAVRFKVLGPVAANYSAAAPTSSSNLGAY